MAEEEEAPEANWTCEYCSCNTNSSQENPTQCGVCGSRRIPGFLRRAGGRSAASRLLANHYGMARAELDDEDMFEEDGLEIQMMGIDDEEQAIAALEAAGIAGAARIPGAMSRRRRFQMAPAAAQREEQQRNQQPTEPPETLWRLAMENAAAYQPKWGTSTQHRGKMRTGHDMEVGSGELQNVARMEDGVAEGRAVRASEPLPRAAHRSQRETTDNSDQGERQRKVYGFRVVFDHPYRDAGMSLGDCYMIGLTTSSFSAFGERNGLLQSPYFWGIEDGGSYFEGARRRRAGARPGGGAPSYGIETSSRDAPRNADNVLFGSQETVTVAVDLENSTMSFWRDGDFIGTLVRNLPQSGYLYPIVVPFNSGVTFAITGMDGSPLPCVKNFNAARKERLQQEANRRRQELIEQRSLLVQNGKLSPDVITALKSIFFSYAGRDDGPSPSEPLLDIVTASRLWYRCGLMLSELAILAEKKAAETAGGAVYDTIISADDFVECMSSVVEEEEAVSSEAFEDGLATYEVGDKVELVHNYAKFGDASSGPLQPGDRGTVVELKEGPGGEIHAIYVSFNANQWWYRPQALMTERSGLIESPSIWFLHKALRTHGYDQIALEPLWGKPLNTTSWEVGDVVVPLSQSQKSDKESESPSVTTDCFGRIAAEAEEPPSSSRSRGRKVDTVLVEFIDPEFGRATGVMNALEDSSDPAIELRRVPIDKLRHIIGGHAQSDVFNNKPISDVNLYEEQSNSAVGTVVVNSKLRAEIEGVSCLDPNSIQSVAKMCDKQPSIGTNSFASGLCDAILTAVDLAEESAKKGKVTDRMGVAVSSLGLLSSIICKGLLSTGAETISTKEDSEMLQEDEGVNLSAILAEASLPLYDRSTTVSEPRRPSNYNRFDPLETLVARRINPSRARGTMFRERTRHSNSTSMRSSRDQSTNDGVARADTRVAISNGLLRNSLPWLKACLQVPHDQSKPGSESFLSRMTNARDENGMSLLLLAITFGCSKELVHHLILSEANISKTEITAAAVSNQPHLLSILLQHSMCPNQVTETLQVSPDVDAVFKAAQARQKVQEEASRRKAEVFLTNLIVSLCRLANTCRSRSSQIQRFGQAACRALVGNVLLRALHESQQKALATASPRRRKHGGSAHLLSDPDSERLSLSVSAPWGSEDSEVFASASAMSPNHGVLLGLPDHFFGVGFLAGPEDDRKGRLSILLAFIESLLWSNEEDSVSTGLTTLHILLKDASVADFSCEIERYGLRDLMTAHEVIAERHLADIRSRLKKTKALETDSDTSIDGGRTNKKRPRAHVATSMPSADDGVVMCPKNHVAELHLTKHSSFRCDLCGKSVMRDRPMHGCRECDWDACETCTDQVEGGIVKWGHILERAVDCRKLLEATDDGGDRMNIDQVYDGSSKISARPGFGELARQLRLRDKSALTDLASKMGTSDQMTNHEFVSFVLPALHAALVDANGATENVDFCINALQALTDLVESSARLEAGGDESQMIVEEVSPHGDGAGMIDTYQQAPTVLSNRIPSSGLLRIQRILSFTENMSVLHVLWDKKRNGAPMSLTGTRLRSLTKPIELNISPWHNSNAGSPPVVAGDTAVFVEPLLPSSVLERHVILTGKIENKTYMSFCRSLSTSKAIVIERPFQRGKNVTSQWRIAQVTGFDEDTGAHALRYPSRSPEARYPSRSPGEGKRGVKRQSNGVPFECIKFDGQDRNVVLAAREYVILRKAEHKSPRRATARKIAAAQSPCVGGDIFSTEFPPEAIPTGIRVETNCASPDPSVWLPCTVIARHVRQKDVHYDIVSDCGEVVREVTKEQLRGYQTSSSSTDGNRNDNEVYRNLRDSLDPEQARNVLRRSGALPFPFFRMGRNAPDPRVGDQVRTESRPTPESGILKRSWSAISPLNEMSPLDIPPASECQQGQNIEAESNMKVWTCVIGDESVEISAKDVSYELPPKLSVEFTAHEKLPPVGSCSDETLVHMLYRLSRRSDESRNDGGILRKKHRLYYSVNLEAESRDDSKSPANSYSQHAGKVSAATLSNEESPFQSNGHDGRRKTFAHVPFDVESLGISEGLDSTSLMCMEVLNVLAISAEEAGVNFRDHRADLNEEPSQRVEKSSDLLSSFENESLSQKLRNQLEDPLMVVSGVLPEWCLAAPSMAPRVFSYASRRQLLFRTAFGVSRSTLKQQEAKVAVGPLRQRMAVLRGRAVELMGEAFSGDAEDPTVLQLQADELYGMEEALASRVTASFRGQRWEERSLQCAKAVVRREMLLIDATNLMERYASDGRMCHRRLEVRFEGESGFDAASGTEAGVTRGFYADVAEALLSSEHVSPLNCPVSCLDPSGQKFGVQLKDLASNIECRLPLWIPDMDSSHQVVIPTPRASPNSTLGVYPRPLLPYDTLLPLVLERFRFMGRLFAAAMRDGLMFPLQLSTSFLKLVQLSSDRPSVAAAAAMPSTDGNAIGATFAGSSLSPTSRSISLTSDDLPRPGFLGGEVYAVEKYICAALDRIDDAEPPISPLEAEEQRQKIASDPQFARVALGKSYDCSFEEYFEDRVFVDPLSPTQGEDAAPLCANGHLRQVTIHNVREWTSLAKKFILHDGVMEQARAFRQGIDDFFSSDYLRIFTAIELQRDVCGGGDKVDRWTEDDIRALFKFDGGRGVTEALVAVAAMGGEGGASLNRRFGSSSTTIGFLVRTLLESTPTQRRQFLSFVTSVPIVTPGKIEVVPMVSPSGDFLPVREGCLPRANTCARRLYLPRFDDYETFNRVLRAVIREESKFKGFYEWRG